MQKPPSAWEQELQECRMQSWHALHAWHAARSYFDEVSEPALVDEAIYQMEAARSRYHYYVARVQELERQPPLSSTSL